jgi:predicted GNAT family acetyltransferase
MNALHDEPRGAGEGRLAQKFDHGVVFAEYRRDGEAVTVMHVEADPALRNTGAAGRFMASLVDWARANDVQIDAHCAYAAHWFSRHPEAADVLSSEDELLRPQKP